MGSSRLILGTAQLGMAYGIANSIGKPAPREAMAIIKTAWEKGISHFDTAQDYGEGEGLLGNILADLAITKDAKITTKLHPDIDLLNKNEVNLAVQKSIQKLKIPRIHCLMLHRDHHLDLLEKGLDIILKGLIYEGYTENIGISVYSTETALKAIYSEIINIVQLPANILDRRFEKAGVFQEARDKGKKIHVRSVFLQGLLLMNTNNLPDRMIFARPVIKEIEKLAEKHKMTRTALALAYVKVKYPDCKIIFGAESPGQVLENCDLWDMNAPDDLINNADALFRNVEEKILNPTLWN